MTFFNKFMGCIQSGDLDECKECFSSNKNIYTKIENEYALIESCNYDNLNILKWLVELHPSSTTNFSDNILFKYACQNDNINIAKYLFDRDKPETHHIICSIEDAILCKNSEMLEWLLSITNIQIDTASELFDNACSVGNLDNVKLIYNSYPTIRTKYNPVYESCINGHFHIVKWLRDIDKTITQYSIDTCTFQYECKVGNLEKAKELYCDSFPILKSLEDAAFNEHIDVLKWIVSLSEFKRNFPIVGKYISKIFQHACNNNKMKTLEWLYSSNILHLHHKPHYLLIQSGFDDAIKYGQLQVVKFLKKNEPFIDQYLKCNKSNIIYNILGNNDNMDYKCINKQGKIDVLEWLIENNENVLFEIFVKNEKDVLKYFKNACKSYNFILLSWLFDKNIQINNTYLANKLFQCLCGKTDLDTLHEYMELCDSKNIVIDKIMDNNNAFYTACVDNNFEIAKYLYDTEKSIRESVYCSDDGDDNWDYYYFSEACEAGHCDIVEWFLEIEPNIKNTWVYEDLAFQDACEFGNLNLIEILYKHKPELDLHHDDDCFFQVACKHGNTHIIKWLLEKAPDIDITMKDHKCFRIICRNNHIHTAQWFKNTYPELYDFKIMNDGVLQEDEYISGYTIHRKLIIKKEICSSTVSIDTCGICYDVDSNIITKCNHMICLKCLEQHLSRNSNSCPFCRTKNIDKELTQIV